MATRKMPRVAGIPATTTLRLFRYPHKFGGGSSWCVGFETSRQAEGSSGRFVSQRYLSEWSEDHAAELARFEGWMAHLGCEGSKEDRE